MAKRKKDSPPNIIIHKCGGDNIEIPTPETNSKDPPKVVRVIIMTVITIATIFMALGLSILMTKLIGKNHGYDSPEKAAETLITAMSEQDKSKLKTCMYAQSGDYRDNISTMWEFVKSRETNWSCDIDSDNNKYEESDCDIKDARKTIGMNQIDDAKYITASLDVVRTDSDVKYQATDIYTVLTYEIDDNWYVYSIENTATEITEYKSDIDIEEPSIVGDDTVGYLSLDESWSLYPSTESEADSVKESVYFISSDETSLITLSAIESSSSIATVADNMQNTLKSNDCDYIQSIDSSIGGISCKNIISYSAEDSTYHYIWLFKLPLYDNYVHYVSLETSSAIDVYKYAQTFRPRATSTN